MKKIFAVLLTAALAVVLMTTLGAQDKPWFDMEKCAFCKHLTAEPELVDHMAWEYHLLSHGMLSITHVDEEYKEAYEHAERNMEKTYAEMTKTGQTPYMCGLCEAYGNLLKTGVKPEHVRSKYGEIVLWTSDDSTAVQNIHKFAKRNIKELAKMEKAKKSE